jgi:hypothetical protein
MIDECKPNQAQDIYFRQFVNDWEQPETSSQERKLRTCDTRVFQCLAKSDFQWQFEL